jgi:hypothetical protein
MSTVHNNDFDFDTNNQDDIIFNGSDNEHSLDEFNIINCDVNDLDLLDGNYEGEDVDVY